MPFSAETLCKEPPKVASRFVNIDRNLRKRFTTKPFVQWAVRIKGFFRRTNDPAGTFTEYKCTGSVITEKG